MYSIFIIMGLAMFGAAFLITLLVEKKEVSLIFPIIVTVVGLAYIVGGIYIFILENKPIKREEEPDESEPESEESTDEASAYDVPIPLGNGFEIIF